MEQKRQIDDPWRDQTRQQVLFLTLARFSFALTVLWVPMCLWLQAYTSLIPALIAVVGTTVPLLLRGAAVYRLSVSIWIVLICVGIFGGAITLGPESRLEIILFVLPGLPFLLLSFRHDRLLMMGLMLVPVVLWLTRLALLDVAATWTEVEPVFARTVLAPIAGLSTFAAVVFQCAYFAVTSRRFVAKIEMARRAAEDSSRAKTAFLSGISHEMRTPLNGVIGLSELIRMEAERRGDRQLEDYALKIAQSGADLLGTVEKTMQFAELSSGRIGITPGPVALELLVARVLTRFRDAATEAGITLQHAAKPKMVLGDATLIEDILGQIIDNAIRYAGAGATVTVSTQERAAGRLRILVEDTGAGFSLPDPEAAFAPFERLNHRASATFGAGMGLTIARIKAEAMGGTVTVDPEVRRGARLVIDLPAA